MTGWTSESFNDADGDGCRDADEDTDVDGDGLIEIATAAQLDAVRHQLMPAGLAVVPVMAMSWLRI